MMFGTRYEQGEIVLVPFPFTNLKAVKKRPVLILSNNPYNDKTEDLITCGITSNLSDSEHSVLIDGADLERGMLQVQSRIKADKLFTLEKSIVIKKLGKINNSTSEKVKNELLKAL